MTKNLIKSDRVVIIGGGLVGSMTALYLGRRGYRVDVYERRVDMRNHEISAGRSINLALAARGMAPLIELGLREEIEAMLIPMTGRMVHALDGSSNHQSYGQRDSEVIYSISRGGLNRLLLDAAERHENVNLYFEHKLEGIDLERDELTVVSPSGEAQTVGFDWLIGADGAGSRVRPMVVEAADGTDVREPLGHSYKELEIPATAEGGFKIEKNALHIWPRGQFMLIALPNLDGSFTVTLFLPNEGEESFKSLEDPSEVGPFFARHFPGIEELIPELERDYQENPTGSLSTVRCDPWYYQDKVLLIGDSAHSIVPFHGQGMNCGFEDCFVLNQILDRAEASGMSRGEINAEFHRLRYANGHAIADMALENYIEMRDSVRDPKFLLKREVGFALERRFPNRFIPRYSMVTFHLIPYAEAQRRGEINNELLDELTRDASDSSEVDWTLAERLVHERLPALELA